MQLKEIVKRHELTEKYLPTLEPKLALAEAHQDRGYLLELVDEIKEAIEYIEPALLNPQCKEVVNEALTRIQAIEKKLESEGGE